MRTAGWIAGVVVAALVAFFALAPGIAERGMNKVVGGPWPVSSRAFALHATLTVADMHADTMLWQRALDERATRGQVDLPRLQDGNVALEVFSSVTKTPKGQNYDRNGADTDNITLLAIAQLQPVRTWGSLLERSLWHAEKLRRAETASDGTLRIVRSAGDLDRLLRDRAARQRVTGAVLSVEGAQNLEGKAANLKILYDVGFRMIGLAHFFDNELAGSMHGIAKGGLTAFGATIVAEMERRGMIVDLAHCSHACFADVMRVATRPVVVSHGGVKATCATNRNLSDDELRALAKNGGIIGIGYWDAAVCAPTPAATARAIRYAVAIMGIDHVGLGSDFDGSVTTGFDTAHLNAVTQALLDVGFDDAQIVKIMGGNVLRTLRAGMVPA